MAAPIAGLVQGKFLGKCLLFSAVGVGSLVFHILGWMLCWPGFKETFQLISLFLMYI